jgi:hypothetical protein
MEGFLIRMPENEESSVRGCLMGEGITTATSFFDRLYASPTLTTPQIYYYILGEGFLSAFKSPDDMEPIEEFQLTGQYIEVEPFYPMSMFYIRARSLEPLDFSVHQHDTDMDELEEENGHFHMINDSSSSDEDEERNHRNEQAVHEPKEKSLLLFAADAKIVQIWCNKLKNWNRYCFDSKPVENIEEERLKLANAFALYTRTQETYGGTIGQEDVVMEEEQEMTITHETIVSNADSLKPSTTMYSEMPWWTMGTFARHRIGVVPPK